MNSKRYIISLGGSLIVPDEIDVDFLKGFKKTIEAGLKSGQEYVLITGGGKTARRYAQTAKALGELNPVDLDWLGIHSTRLNGHLMRTIFRKHAVPEIITNPLDKRKLKGKLLVAAGYRPGWSTDYVAILLAQKYQAKVVLNLSNIDYVYDKDPRKFKDAKPIHEISWKDFRKIVGNKWDPGIHTPFDPVASKLAQELKLQVVVVNGKNISNLKNFLQGKKFIGTVIS